jgi:hypothetical protein
MVCGMAAPKPMKPGILALTPKASRFRQVFWLSWFLSAFPTAKWRPVAQID